MISEVDAARARVLSRMFWRTGDPPLSLLLDNLVAEVGAEWDRRWLDLCDYCTEWPAARLDGSGIVEILGLVASNGHWERGHESA